MKPRKTVQYFSVPVHRKVVCTTQRVASVSMIESLAPMFPRNFNSNIPVAQVLELRSGGWDVLQWIRDPLDRLACAYDVFGPRFESVDAYVAHCIATQNPHWSPQSDLHRQVQPTRCFLFERLAESWAEQLPNFPLIHIGANPNRAQWADLRKDLSDELYERALDHWNEDIQHRDAMFRRREMAA